MQRLVILAICLAVVLTGCGVEDIVIETPTISTSPQPTATRLPATPTPNPEPTSSVRSFAAGPVEQSTASPVPPPIGPPATLTSAPGPTATSDPLADMVLVDVTRVIDGDTIEVANNGQVRSIRLIGVETPEIVHPEQPVQCFGLEVSVFTTTMIDRARWQVYLEKDVSQTDLYDRLLRYVWLPHSDGMRMLNQELVSQGYAQVSTYPPDVRYADLFRQSHDAAQSSGKGLWGVCGEFGVPIATPTPVSQPTPLPVPPVQSSNCDPSYPDVCIPPYPPDLNCGDIPFRRFRVTGPDSHGFDRDRDGIGCESG